MGGGAPGTGNQATGGMGGDPKTESDLNGEDVVDAEIVEDKKKKEKKK